MALTTVNISSGLVSPSSCSSETVSAYLGIPYAKAPIGEWRWRSPQKVEPWSDVRVCETYGPSAPQAPKRPGTFYTKEFPDVGDERYDEDCLYVNVFTAATSSQDKLPVLLNIHGGGFVGGSGRDIQFDGFGLSNRGAILVNINYRLGIFGFLAHPWLQDEDAVGCFGLADQIAALTWVHDNIAAFGGDPDNITILGQSAGAMSIQLLLAAPRAKDLLAGAIMQSGGGILPMMDSVSLDKAMQVGTALVEAAGISSLEELRSTPVEVLDNVVYDVMVSSGQGMLFSPSVGSKTIPYGVKEAAEKGLYANIPYLLGSNKKEEPLPEPMATMFHEGALAFGKTILAQNRQAPYLYNFHRVLPGDDIGTFHSAELWYVFGSYQHCWRELGKEDIALSVKMMDAWIHFANDGTPGILDWHPYDGSAESEYILDITA